MTQFVTRSYDPSRWCFTPDAPKRRRQRHTGPLMTLILALSCTFVGLVTALFSTVLTFAALATNQDWRPLLLAASCSWVAVVYMSYQSMWAANWVRECDRLDEEAGK